MAKDPPSPQGDTRGPDAHLCLFPQDISSFLAANAYTKAATFFHTHFPQGRTGSDIYIYERAQKPLWRPSGAT